MKKCFIILFAIFLTATLGLTNEELNETVQITEKDYLQLVIGSYIWGFNEFDTEIVIYLNLLRINIF